jgi:hypothetical protein
LSHEPLQLVGSQRETIVLPGGIVLEPYTRSTPERLVESGYFVKLDWQPEARLTSTDDGWVFGHPFTAMFDAHVPGDLAAICQRIVERASPLSQRVDLLRQQVQVANDALHAAQHCQRIELSNAICIEEEGP